MKLSFAQINHLWLAIFQVPDSAEQHLFQRLPATSVRQFQRRRRPAALHVADEVDDGQAEGGEDRLRRQEDVVGHAEADRITEHFQHSETDGSATD